MSECVWVSLGYTDSALIIPFRDPDTSLTFREQAKLILSMRRGMPVDKSLLPSRLVFDGPHGERPDVVHSIFVDAHFCVSEPAMNLMKDFDMGMNDFFQISLLDKKLIPITQIPYYGVMFSETKTTASGGSALLENKYKPGEFVLDSPLQDGAVEVFDGAGTTSDMWIDPAVPGAVFFSDRLHRALRESGHLESMSVSQCRLGKGQ